MTETIAETKVPTKEVKTNTDGEPTKSDETTTKTENPKSPGGGAAAGSDGVTAEQPIKVNNKSNFTKDATADVVCYRISGGVAEAQIWLDLNVILGSDTMFRKV